MYPVDVLQKIQDCNITAFDVKTFSDMNGLVVYEYPEHIKFVIVLVAFGFVVGIIATLIFQRSYRRGKRYAADRERRNTE